MSFISNIPEAIAVSVGFSSLIGGAVAWLRMYYKDREKNGNNTATTTFDVLTIAKTAAKEATTQMHEVVKARDYQTNQDVNTTVTSRFNEFRKQVCEPQWKKSNEEDESIKTEMKELRTAQDNHGKTLISMDTTLKLVAKKLDI